MPNTILLRDVIASDLPIFFEQQRDPVANQLAAFPAREREAFMAHWAKILADKSNILKTILVDGQVAGNIVSWEQPDEGNKREVGYWLGREFWGKGIATRALTLFLERVTARPLYAHVVRHNLASIRVLEKCGFTIAGEDQGLSSTGGEEVEEVILILHE
jgi:RimJ/RimL family protein N-acetyltransferase